MGQLRGFGEWVRRLVVRLQHAGEEREQDFRAHRATARRAALPANARPRDASAATTPGRTWSARRSGAGALALEVRYDEPGRAGRSAAGLHHVASGVVDVEPERA